MNLHGNWSGETQSTSEVLVVSTLHGLHADIPSYGFAHLARIVESLAPDVMAIEVDPAELVARSAKYSKPEYPAAIYPLLSRQPIEVVPLEPGEPLRSEMLALAQEEGERMMREAPAAMNALVEFFQALAKFLCASWDSPVAVNSPDTDTLFKAKHAYQDVLLPGHAEGWRRWNEFFLDQITTAALARPGRRVLVLVGAEHSYWLRERLAKDERLRLLATHDAIASLGDAYA